MNVDGEVLKPPMQLTKLGIYRVRDLKSRDLQSRVPTSLDDSTIESDLTQIKTDKVCSPMKTFIGILYGDDFFI